MLVYITKILTFLFQVLATVLKDTLIEPSSLFILYTVSGNRLHQYCFIHFTRASETNFPGGTKVNSGPQNVIGANGVKSFFVRQV